MKQVYRVSFADGRQTLCCDEHLWRVYTDHWGEWRDVELRQLRGYARLKDFFVPLGVSDHGFQDADWPIQPYLMGVLLGDGTFNQHAVRFSTPDAEIVATVQMMLPQGHLVKASGGYDYTITGDGWRNNRILNAIREFGLADARSHTKFVPRCYLQAGPLARNLLLKGLIDSDGTVEASKTIRFSSTSRDLADAVVYLTRSLGGTAKLRQRATPKYMYKGELREGKPCWIVTIRHPQPHSLFALSRQKDKLGDGGQFASTLKLSIESIEPVCEMECQCIKLDDEDGLYFTDDFIVTHNTVMMTNLAYNVAKQGVGVLEISLEIPDDELQARHVAQAIYDNRRPLTFSEIQEASNLSDEDAERVIRAQRDFLKIPLVAECPARMTVAEIAARIHVERKRMADKGVKLGVVLIDYLDKIAATDRYRGQRPMEIQDVMDALKAAARAEDVCIVLLAQVSRGTEGREDKRPGLMDLRSSGAIEHEAHAIIFVYRPSYYISKSHEFREGQAEAHAEFRRTFNDVELIIGKNRGGQETTVKLWGDVGCSYLTSTSGAAP